MELTNVIVLSSILVTQQHGLLELLSPLPSATNTTHWGATRQQETVWRKTKLGMCYEHFEPGWQASTNVVIPIGILEYPVETRWVTNKSERTK